MWECHVDDSSESRYCVILGRYLLSVLDFFSGNVIKEGDGLFEWFTDPIFNLGKY